MNRINSVIAVLFCGIYAYQIFYLIVPFFRKRQRNKPVKYHKYAVLISARNEESVLPQLLQSLRNQTYPAELIKIFVVADNCTDRTAETAARLGAQVYERFHTTRVGKGYALEYLLQNIEGEYGKAYFDAYLVFDADNLLAENYIEEMNRTFSAGYSIVTSYRNSKNYGKNWISSGYALWFLRESKYLNQARMQLGTSCAVSGTGFLVAGEVLEKYGGWKFHLLTEDIEFTVHSVIHQEKIGYCGSAVLYDEQPVTFSQSWKQRLRWAKGYLQVYRKYGRRLLRGIFRLGGFACFDMSMSILPAFLLSFLGTAANFVSLVVGPAFGTDFGTVLRQSAVSFLCSYFFLFGLGLLTLLTEWKRIYARTGRKIASAFTFPLFMMTYLPIAVTALFKKVKWDPIRHEVPLSLEQVRNVN